MSRKISKLFEKIFLPIWRNIFIRTLGVLLIIIPVLQAFDLWTKILAGFIATYNFALIILLSTIFGIPNYIWLSLIVLLIILYWVLYRTRRYLKLVAGEFKDNFNKGLNKWDYGNEGWTQEKEEGEYVLSVRNSDRGGITKTGFWDSFSFSFYNKVVGNGVVGWLVKAWDRSNYIMLQLRISEDGVFIRPHFRWRGKWIIWPSQKLNPSERVAKLLRIYNWFFVKLNVEANTIDVYIEGEHIFHLQVDDPLSVVDLKDLEYQDEKGDKRGKFTISESNLFSYPGGRVGFRCAPTEEHAFFKDVKVKPVR